MHKLTLQCNEIPTDRSSRLCLYLCLDDSRFPWCRIFRSVQINISIGIGWNSGQSEPRVCVCRLYLKFITFLSYHVAIWFIVQRIALLLPLLAVARASTFLQPAASIIHRHSTLILWEIVLIFGIGCTGHLDLYEYIEC